MGDGPSDSRSLGLRFSFRRRPVPGPLRSVIGPPSGTGTVLATLSGAAAIAVVGLILLSSRQGDERPPIRSTLVDPVYTAPVTAAVPAKAAGPIAAPIATPPALHEIIHPVPQPSLRSEAQSRGAPPPALTLDLLPVLSRQAAEISQAAPAEPKLRKSASPR
jgi:hypothetical protein